MNFAIKPQIEKLLNEVIKDKNLERRNKMIIELKSILQLISNIENNSNDFNGIKRITILSSSKTGYSEYRVIDDTDSEDCTLWLEIDNLRLSEGDILLELK